MSALSLFRRLGFARALVALALVGLGLRVVTPTGFMLAPVGGQLTVVLCTGDGPKTITLDLGTQKPAKDMPGNGGKTEAPCMFSAVAQMSSPERAPIAAPLLLANVVTPPQAPRAQPGRGLAAPPPWSTGPPALA